MNCPYCNNPMTSGFVQSGREVYFTEKPHKVLFGRRKGEVLLTKNNMTAPTCEAYRCVKCRKVIVRYEK